MITVKQIQNNATVTDGTDTITLGAGDSYTCSIPNPPSGIAYQRPQPTGQTISYRTGDDAWQVVNNPYNEPPSNPLYTQSLVDFFTLKHDNAFGNRFRFTDESGNLYADFTQAFTSGDYMIDNLSGLGYGVNFESNAYTSWNDSIDECNNLTALGYSDWYLPNYNEWEFIFYIETNIYGFVTPFIGGVRIRWSSTTFKTDTAKAYANYDRNDGFTLYPLTKTSTQSALRYVPIRQHF